MGTLLIIVSLLIGSITTICAWIEDIEDCHADPTGCARAYMITFALFISGLFLISHR